MMQQEVNGMKLSKREAEIVAWARKSPIPANEYLLRFYEEETRQRRPDRSRQLTDLIDDFGFPIAVIAVCRAAQNGEYGMIKIRQYAEEAARRGEGE